MLDKIFGWKKRRSEPDPEISFGRYSDNNKPLEKVNRWSEADGLFKDKKIYESFDAFFDYLLDDGIQNVKHSRADNEGSFCIYQGSKIVRGSYNKEHLKAEVTLARMATPSVPVMRRLLEMNFNLYYSRYALDSERLCMRFDTDTFNASPSKLYYGLKELATRGDKQDDLLVQDFTILETVDTEHVTPLPDEEKEVKRRFMQKWIADVLDTIQNLDAEKFSGGIAYLLLSLLYRIDFLISPEGKLLNEFEKIVQLYYKKDDRPVVEKNRDMIEAVKKIHAKTKEEIFPYLFRSKYTFSIAMPQTYKYVSDAIYNANQNVTWYRDNGYPFIARQITEYGISYCQYSYSLPRPVTELFLLFMMVNYSEYFAALGFKRLYYDTSNKKLNEEGIKERIEEIEEQWKPKYPHFQFKFDSLKFTSLIAFDLSFTNGVESLNLEK
jgi:hypothetical protein